MNTLPVRKAGDKATGEPCIVPAGLNFCEVCDCYTRARLRFIRVSGYPYPVCSAHSVEEIEQWKAADAVAEAVGEGEL